MGMADISPNKEELELTLTLQVKYRTNGISKYELAEALKRMCRRGAGNGDFTDINGRATVLSWQESVTTKGGAS